MRRPTDAELEAAREWLDRYPATGRQALLLYQPDAREAVAELVAAVVGQMVRTVERPVRPGTAWRPGAGDCTTTCDLCGETKVIVAWGWPGAVSACSDCVAERDIKPVT